MRIIVYKMSVLEALMPFSMSRFISGDWKTLFVQSIYIFGLDILLSNLVKGLREKYENSFRFSAVFLCLLIHVTSFTVVSECRFKNCLSYNELKGYLTTLNAMFLGCFISTG